MSQFVDPQKYFEFVDKTTSHPSKNTTEFIRRIEKEKKEQEAELTQLTSSHNDLEIELDKYKNVEILWDELVELKGKYQKWIVLKEKAESELSRLETRIELLETQLDNVEEDIEKYYENEDTIEQNRDIQDKIDLAKDLISARE